LRLRLEALGERISGTSMPRLFTNRIDELPLDRRIAGEARGFRRDSLINALYERRDIDPLGAHIKRRTGSLRVTSVQPKLLGAATNADDGKIVINRNFRPEISTNDAWTMFGTLLVPDILNSSTGYQRLISFDGIELFFYFDPTPSGAPTTPSYSLIVSDHAGVALAATTVLPIATYTDMRFMLGRTSTGVKLNIWEVETEAIVFTEQTNTHTYQETQKDLVIFGESIWRDNLIKGLVLNNILLYDADIFARADYETFARDPDPATSLTSPGDSDLLWHNAFSAGGNVAVYTNDSEAEVFSYLVPTAPTTYGTDPTEILFGGKGVIEIPFYLDFDEYFWTSANQSARLEWCFQVKLTLPDVLTDSTIFELQDLVGLRVVFDSVSEKYNFVSNFSDTGTLVTNLLLNNTLVGGDSYNVFVARDTSYVYLRVEEDKAGGLSAMMSGTAPNPIIYAYDKTIGFTVGDRVDFENADPFGGRLERFALFNNSSQQLQLREDAVIYYDVQSVQGDEIIDRGNRALNGYSGVRSTSRAPFYREGALTGGAYVAATGGYLISNSKPSIGYTGELSKAILKDAVVQRLGERSFLTSNNVSYVVNDRNKTFRPLGIQRPSTKVTCTPQGVGPIDGFVRYAYRFVSTDGTVGPTFELDPCEATGGVNVFLGAEAFGSQTNPVFGLAFGEAEGDEIVTNNGIETFIVKDTDNSEPPNQLLHREIADPGLTLEVAFRVPSFGPSALSEESVISQGVYMPYTTTSSGNSNTWWARNEPVHFPWIGASSQESCFQLTFRYSENFLSSPQNQILIAIGNPHQRYKTGWNSHDRCLLFCVSIQKTYNSSPLSSTGVVVCKQNGARDNALYAEIADYQFQDQHDYTIFVSRGGQLYGTQRGSDCIICIFDHTLDSPSVNGWQQWPDPLTTQLRIVNFFGPTWAHANTDYVMWGTGRQQGDASGVRTRRWTGSGWAFSYISPFYNGTGEGNVLGQRLYHGRMWAKDFYIGILAIKGLDRDGTRSGPLAELCKIDTAFCSDSSVSELEGGWDRINDCRAKFYATPGTSSVSANVVLGDGNANQTTFIAYGYDNTITANSPTNTHSVTSTDQIPMWAAYSARNGGALVVGTGHRNCFELAKRKWHDGSGVRTFDEFANVIDLKEWTWLTLYFRQSPRVTNSEILDVILIRIFIDGNTGEWGEVWSVDITPDGPQGKFNWGTLETAGDGARTLYTLGGVPGIDSEYEIEIAESRLWNGERYSALGGGQGANTFGTYISSRVPPNLWESMWHYLRFAPIDVDDMETQTAMDQHGQFPYLLPGSTTTFTNQATADAVTIYQGAEVKTGESSGSGGAHYFIPFPVPPMSAIRGIQIFRSQITPLQETFPTGEINPNATIDAFKACRAAPLYYLSEIPDGTNFYFDTAIDTLLGAKLDVSEGLIPRNVGGVFEWGGFLGMWITDIPRIYFSASPSSWESFPSDMILDIPLREYGPIEAATELASRDARQSRVLVLGKSWGAFIDGSPTQARVNTVGGGVGASTSRCLVVEKGVAYAYNGTLWAITGDGGIEDIGMPVLDLLPSPEHTRLAVSSALGSLFVINELTGIALRWHFARGEWFVEDRYCVGTTDILGEDHWIHLTGYPSKGSSTVYADDVEADTETSYTVSDFDNAANTVTLSVSTGLKIGQHLTLVATEDPRERQSVSIESLDGAVVTTAEDLVLEESGVVPTASPSGEAAVTYTYKAYVGIGHWGTMLDTGQFINKGSLNYVDLGITSGDRWYGMHSTSDFTRDPSQRSGFDSIETYPTRFDDGEGNGQSARWGLSAQQRVQRLILWSMEPSAVGISELELNYSVE